MQETRAQDVSVYFSPMETPKGRPPRGKLNKADIGSPSNFTHVTHIGWNSVTGFDAGSDADLKRLFNLAGIREEHLRDRDTSRKIFEVIEKKGGMAAVRNEARRMTAVERPSSRYRLRSLSSSQLTPSKRQSSVPSPHTAKMPTTLPLGSPFSYLPSISKVPPPMPTPPPLSYLPSMRPLPPPPCLGNYSPSSVLTPPSANRVPPIPPRSKNKLPVVFVPPCPTHRPPLPPLIQRSPLGPLPLPTSIQNSALGPLPLLPLPTPIQNSALGPLPLPTSIQNSALGPLPPLPLPTSIQNSALGPLPLPTSIQNSALGPLPPLPPPMPSFPSSASAPLPGDPTNGMVPPPPPLLSFNKHHSESKVSSLPPPLTGPFSDGAVPAPASAFKRVAQSKEIKREGTQHSNRGDDPPVFLEQIKQGVQLKSVAVAAKVGPPHCSSTHEIVTALMDVIQKRHRAIHSSGEEDGDNADEWED
ncbi:uncharacterized protein LOC142468451 [Ascaphus truei]|uniref:uncharacterized protein LOC142468451 n=1 Tax=Ascaphus truei TaxID=8439 RepID=UPI003F5AD5F2